MVSNTTGGQTGLDFSRMVAHSRWLMSKKSKDLVDVFVTVEEIAAAIRKQTPATANRDPLALLTSTPLEIYPTVAEAVARAKELRKLGKNVMLLLP